MIIWNSLQAQVLSASGMFTIMDELAPTTDDLKHNVGSHLMALLKEMTEATMKLWFERMDLPTAGMLASRIAKMDHFLSLVLVKSANPLSIFAQSESDFLK
jgi:hypothetical protein